MLLLFLFFASSLSTPLVYIDAAHPTVTSADPLSQSTNYAGTTDSTTINSIGLGVFEVMVADLADDGQINFSPIDWSKRNATYGVLLDQTAISLVNRSAEFGEVLTAGWQLHNKVVWLEELYKCGSSPPNQGYSGCANYSDYESEAAFKNAIFDYAKLVTVRFFQASVEFLGRSFFTNDITHNTYFLAYGTPVNLTMYSIFNRSLGTPVRYSANGRLDASVMDYSLSMHADPTLFDVTHPLQNFSTSQSPCNSFGAITGSNTPNPRRLNMFRTLARPFHSQILSTFTANAGAKDTEAISLGLTNYEALLTNLSLSSTGHPFPSANPFVGALLDTNPSNHINYSTSTRHVPTLPKTVWAATFQRAHDSIVSDPNGVITKVGDAEANHPQNQGLEFIPEYDLWYDCWQDPSITPTSYPRQSCNDISIWAFTFLSNSMYNYMSAGSEKALTYPLAIRYTDRADAEQHMVRSLASIWYFTTFDRGQPKDFRAIWAVDDYSIHVPVYASKGIRACIPDDVYIGTQNTMYGCGQCP